MEDFNNDRSDHYKWLTPFYTKLSRIVFADRLKIAKLHDMNLIDTQADVLIIGGGDGIDYVDWICSHSGQVVYLEASLSMLQRAKHHLRKDNLYFINSDRLDSVQGKFDAVILHFVLDTMNDESIAYLLASLKNKLHLKAKLFITDFYPSRKINHQLLTWGMINLFRVLVKHPRRNLPNYHQHLIDAGYQLDKSTNFSNGWIKSRVYKLN